MILKIGITLEGYDRRGPKDLGKALVILYVRPMLSKKRTEMGKIMIEGCDKRQSSRVGVGFGTKSWDWVKE